MLLLMAGGRWDAVLEGWVETWCPVEGLGEALLMETDSYDGTWLKIIAFLQLLPVPPTFP